MSETKIEMETKEDKTHENEALELLARAPTLPSSPPPAPKISFKKLKQILRAAAVIIFLLTILASSVTTLFTSTHHSAEGEGARGTVMDKVERLSHMVFKLLKVVDGTPFIGAVSTEHSKTTSQEPEQFTSKIFKLINDDATTPSGAT